MMHAIEEAENLKVNDMDKETNFSVPDNVRAKLVNELRDVAVSHHNHQSLREKISKVVSSYITKVHPVGAQKPLRTTIQYLRLESSVFSRAMEHPTVLEIMAACAQIIETESSAVVGPEYDGYALSSTAKRYLEQAAKIRESDPDIWEGCPVGGFTQPSPAVAINERLLKALKGLMHEEGGSIAYAASNPKCKAVMDAIAAAEAEAAKK